MPRQTTASCMPTASKLLFAADWKGGRLKGVGYMQAGRMRHVANLSPLGRFTSGARLFTVRQSPAIFA
jgi:hypothetical protein